MGYKIDWDKNRIWTDLSRMMAEVASPYNDGFIQWNCKQDLYQIKQLVDQALSKSPHFGELEEQWLLEQEKKHIIKILKS